MHPSCQMPSAYTPRVVVKREAEAGTRNPEASQKYSQHLSPSPCPQRMLCGVVTLQTAGMTPSLGLVTVSSTVFKKGQCWVLCPLLEAIWGNGLVCALEI